MSSTEWNVDFLKETMDRFMEGVLDDRLASGDKVDPKISALECKTINTLCKFACDTIEQQLSKKVDSKIVEVSKVDESKPINDVTFYIQTRRQNPGMGFLSSGTEDRIRECNTRAELTEIVNNLLSNGQSVVQIIVGKVLPMKVETTFP